MVQHFNCQTVCEICLFTLTILSLENGCQRSWNALFIYIRQSYGYDFVSVSIKTSPALERDLEMHWTRICSGFDDYLFWDILSSFVSCIGLLPFLLAYLEEWIRAIIWVSPAATLFWSHNPESRCVFFLNITMLVSIKQWGRIKKSVKHSLFIYTQYKLKGNVVQIVVVVCMCVYVHTKRKKPPIATVPSLLWIWTSVGVLNKF